MRNSCVGPDFTSTQRCPDVGVILVLDGEATAVGVIQRFLHNLTGAVIQDRNRFNLVIGIILHLGIVPVSFLHQRNARGPCVGVRLG